MSTNAFAQRLTATGKVTYAAGLEVIGASVLEKGTAVSYTHLLSRNKVAVPEGAAGTPPFWSDVSTRSLVLEVMLP